MRESTITTKEQLRMENERLRYALRRAAWHGINELGKCDECARKLAEWVSGMMIRPLPEMCADCRKIQRECGGPE